MEKNVIHLMTTSPHENEGELSPADQLLWQAISDRGFAGKWFTPHEVDIIFTPTEAKLFLRGEPLAVGTLLVRLMRGAVERAYEVACTRLKSLAVMFQIQ